MPFSAVKKPGKRFDFRFDCAKLTGPGKRVPPRALCFRFLHKRNFAPQVPLHIFAWWFANTPAESRTSADWIAVREYCNRNNLEIDHRDSNPRNCVSSNLDITLKKLNLKKRKR